MKILFRAAMALLAAMLCVPAMAIDPNLGMQVAAPAGFLPSGAIYCADANGKAITCPFGILQSSTGAPNWSNSYVATGNGYAAYATPTDLFCLSGSATKTVVVSRAEISAHTSATTNVTYSLIRRSAANTGGTSTNPAGVPLDSAEAAATAVTTLYSAAPATLGTSAGTLRIIEANGTVTTAAAGVGAEALTSTVTEARRPVTLHTGEQLCLNMGGAALPSGYSAQWYLEWSEY